MMPVGRGWHSPDAPERAARHKRRLPPGHHVTTEDPMPFFRSSSPGTGSLCGKSGSRAFPDTSARPVSRPSFSAIKAGPGWIQPLPAAVIGCRPDVIASSRNRVRAMPAREAAWADPPLIAIPVLVRPVSARRCQSHIAAGITLPESEGGRDAARPVPSPFHRPGTRPRPEAPAAGRPDPASIQRGAAGMPQPAPCDRRHTACTTLARKTLPSKRSVRACQPTIHAIP